MTAQKWVRNIRKQLYRRCEMWKHHDVFGKTEQFRMAETFAGPVGNEIVMIRGASLWRGLLITFFLYLTNNY